MILTVVSTIINLIAAFVTFAIVRDRREWDETTKYLWLLFFMNASFFIIGVLMLMGGK